MVIYKCYRCGYTGSISSIKKHCKRKSACAPILEDIEVNFEGFLKRHNTEHNKENSNYLCETCLKKFTSNQTLKHHLAKSCKIKNNSENTLSGNNNNNNGNNADIIGDKNTIATITINNYGSENIKYLVDDKMLSEYCIKHGISSHRFIYNNLFFNKEHPENQTVKPSEINATSAVKIYKNGKYVEAGMENILDDIIDKTVGILITSAKQNMIMSDEGRLRFAFGDNANPNNFLAPIKSPSRDDRRGSKQSLKVMLANDPTEPNFPPEIEKAKKREYYILMERFLNKYIDDEQYEINDLMRFSKESRTKVENEYVSKNFLGDTNLTDNEENIAIVDKILKQRLQKSQKE